MQRPASGLLRLLHSPDRDRRVGPGLLAPEHLVAPRSRRSVEYDQVAFLCRAAIHVCARLLQPRSDGAVQTAVTDLALDDDALRSRPGSGSGFRPDDQQVGAHSPQPVFPLDPSTAVDHPLQERLQQQLRPRLLVLVALEPVLRMLSAVPCWRCRWMRFRSFPCTPYARAVPYALISAPPHRCCPRPASPAVRRASPDPFPAPRRAGGRCTRGAEAGTSRPSDLPRRPCLPS